MGTSENRLCRAIVFCVERVLFIRVRAHRKQIIFSFSTFLSLDSSFRFEKYDTFSPSIRSHKSYVSESSTDILFGDGDSEGLQRKLVDILMCMKNQGSNSNAFKICYIYAVASCIPSVWLCFILVTMFSFRGGQVVIRLFNRWIA